MRSVLIAALSAAMAAPAAWAQEAKPRPPEDIAPGPLREPGPVAPSWDAPHAGDPALPTIGAPGDAAATPTVTPPATPPVTPGGPLHPGDEILPPDAYKKAPPPKPKLDEAAGGLAGGVIGQVAGTAVGGPVGGIAASLVGGRIGTGAVRIGRKILGRDKKPGEQAAAASDEGHQAAATEPARRTGPAEAEPRPADGPS
jgi:hypothetical protein